MVINSLLIDIPKDIENIKKSDLREDIKQEEIAWKQGMHCAFECVLRCITDNKEFFDIFNKKPNIY